MNYDLRITISILATLFLLPVFAHAADPGFVALSPIPGIDITDKTTLAEYLSAVFSVIISVGAVLAVIMIMWGGFEYMTSESIQSKGAGVKTIQHAVVGLLLLLMSYLILYVINPDLLKLTSFNSSLGGIKTDFAPSPFAGGSSAPSAATVGNTVYVGKSIVGSTYYVGFSGSTCAPTMNINNKSYKRLSTENKAYCGSTASANSCCSYVPGK